MRKVLSFKFIYLFLSLVLFFFFSKPVVTFANTPLQTLQGCINRLSCLEVAISNTGVKTALRDNTYTASVFNLSVGGSMANPPSFSLTRATNTIPSFGFSKDSSGDFTGINSIYFDSSGLTTLRDKAITLFCASDPGSSQCGGVAGSVPRSWVSFPADLNNLQSYPSNIILSTCAWTFPALGYFSPSLTQYNSVGAQSIGISMSWTCKNTSNQTLSYSTSRTLTVTAGLGGFAQPYFSGRNRANPSSPNLLQVEVLEGALSNGQPLDWGQWSATQKNNAIALLENQDYLDVIQSYDYYPNPGGGTNVVVTIPSHATSDNNYSYSSAALTVTIQGNCLTNAGVGCTPTQPPDTPPGDDPGNNDNDGSNTVIPGTPYDADWDGNDPISPSTSLAGAQNFFQHFFSVASNKFPFDVVGSFDSSVLNKCPTIEFGFNSALVSGSQDTIEFCQINDVVAAAKYPMILSWLLKLVIS